MTALSVSGVTKTFGGTEVLRGINLLVPEGGLTAILGPSGCGKTTLLRLIVGFETPDSGTITVGGTTVSDAGHFLPPERRGVGYVAQEGALFPHLNVAANITFGLGRRDRRARRRVTELLELVGMSPGYANRYPHQLSGGEQQRVALARAMCPQPALVLLDEPFSALDAGLRAETRLAVADALAASATTAVLVTHDQSEALSMAHQVAIMRDGVLAQTATPTELYGAPRDLGVAEFVGEAVILAGTVHGASAACALGRVLVRPVGREGLAPDDGPARLMIRPEQIVIHGDDGDAGGVRARVQDRTFYGHDASVALRLTADGTLITCRCAGSGLPAPGADVTLTVEGEVLAFPA